jgi:hypothetical protein
MDATNMKTRSRPSFKAATGSENDGTSYSKKSGDDNKEAKVQKSQAQRLRHFVLFFVLLSALAFLVATHQEATHIHTTTTSNNSNGNAVPGPAAAGPTLEYLQRTVDALDLKVRTHKAKPNMIMEQDSEGMKFSKELQHATHQLMVKRYGRHTFRVRVDLLFPDVIVAKDKSLPAEDYFVIELAPMDLIPCSVYNFLEIARTWKSGAFHRNANHVLQVASHSQVKKSMPFQEYSPEYPHQKGTTGYAGRPSGPGWYVSTMDNTVNHGPGSQQQKNPLEADSLFGRIVYGFDTVIPRIHSTPQNGWLDKEHQIQIPKMTIWIQVKKKSDGGEGTTKEWVPWTPLDPLTSIGADNSAVVARQQR